ncbi:MAG: hypothetical protein HOL01_14355 [Planctomycetaceae bacterium]|nr:hypothetical protein [Planctomycetaceae bacterium]
MNSPPAESVSPFGFILVAFLLGSGYGYAAVDVCAWGLRWHSHYYVVIVTGVVGLVIGWILNAAISNRRIRSVLLTIAWTIAGISLFIFLLIGPAIRSTY